jgi:hypothetical protein
MTASATESKNVDTAPQMKDQLKNLTETLELYFVKKAPALPTNVKEFLVQAAPWISILSVVLSIPVFLGFLGLGAMFANPYFGGYMMANAGAKYTLALIVLGVTLVLRVLSIPGLKAKTMSGWNYMYYSTLVYAVYSLVSFEFVSLIVGTAISLYFLFQVKSYYK